MNKVQTHDAHAAEDYIEDGCLFPEAVLVRLVRVARHSKNNTATLKHRWYDVEVSIHDSAYTFNTDVANALERRGFKVWIDGRGKNGIVIYAPNYRAPRGFVAVRDLPAPARA